MANRRFLVGKFGAATSRAVVLGALLVALVAVPASAAAASSSTVPSHAASASWSTWGNGKTLTVDPGLVHPVPPTGQTPHVSGETTQEGVTTNWAGLVDTGTTFTAASSNWTVPSVQLPPSTGVSSTWVGIDGGIDSDPTIVQTGTSENITGGVTNYFAWYEVYPAPAVDVGQVFPGDQMFGEVFENSPDTWTINLQDQTTAEGISGNVAYDGSGATAEWIEEQQQVDPGPEPPLANFGSATFTNLGITPADASAVVDTPDIMVNGATGVVDAYPSFGGNDDMTVNYGQPTTTTSVSTSPSSVVSATPVTYSATVASNGQGTPQGDVTFSTGSTTLCSATLSSNGTASCTADFAPPGTDTITGTYPGDNVSAGSSGTATLVVTPQAVVGPPQHGYWLVGSDGGIFTFGSAQFYGSTGSLKLQRPVVGIVPTRDDGGYWLDASDGGVFAYGDTQFYGSIPGLGIHPYGSGLPNSLDAPIVGMVPSADDGGYFMVGSDGGVFAFGDAHFAGSCPGSGGCLGAAVAVMPDATGNGYWVVTQTGHVYTFGDAPYYGAPGPQGVSVTSAVRTPDGGGYWILFANGAIANYGDAQNFGSPAGQMGGLDPAAAIFTTSDGAGYWVAAANGAVANFGDAPNDGSMLGTKLNGSIIAATGW